MSAHEQGDEGPSAGAAAAAAPTAGEGQQSKQHALEEKMRELEADIKGLKTKIASDEAEVKTIKSEAERVEFRGTIKEDKKRLNLLEVERAELRQDIKKLSAPVERPTAAGGCCPTSCLPLRSRIAGYCARSSCYENLTAPSTCAHALPRAPHVTLRGLCVRHLCMCITRLCASMVLRHRCPTG